MFFKHTSKAIGELAASQPGPKDIGWPKFLIQSVITALILTAFMGGIMAVVVLALEWSMKH